MVCWMQKQFVEEIGYVYVIVGYMIKCEVILKVDKVDVVL